MSLSRRGFLTSTAALAVPGMAAAPQGISLAEWSFSASFFQGKWKLLELPGILRNKLGIDALEHVNQFFENPVLTYLQKVKRACADSGVRSTILMVDGEGATASPDKAERRQAAIAHRKWIDTAHYLGCISVRCNVYGGAADWKQDRDLVDRAAETLNSILEYSAGSDLNVIVENHGAASSDPDVLVALVKKVNHPKFGLLCDLGNWNKGEDRYAAVRKILPYAKGLSVKGTWGPAMDPAFDAEKLVKTALDGGYAGYWGIEVTPRRERGQKVPVEQQFEDEVKTVLEAKVITERVVLKKG
ncbi:MAG TPA: TIM barrel protein [Bryobacteraceae bacterium]|nr:TIM barrel protein [Bryobacteraceae bacterium]